MSWNFVFHSGMSAKSDMRGGIDAGAAIGVVANLLSNTKLFLSLPRYLDGGGKVFVDSGAFTAFRKNEAVDWPLVLRNYSTLIAATMKPANLSIVAPDVVGDQEATLALWREHATAIESWVKAGARVIMPLQVGELSASQMLEHALSIVGSTSICAGIPSNLAAMPADQCAAIRHDDFHILGRVVLTDEIRLKLQAIKTSNPQATVSADANWLRSRLAKLKSIATCPPSPSNCFASRRTQAVHKLLELEMYQLG